MPAATSFKNTSAKRQISTTVPEELYEILAERVELAMRVRPDYTMSMLLRELALESAMMKGGAMQPSWSIELSESLSAVREEIAELRSQISTQPQTAQSEPAQDEKHAASWPAMRRESPDYDLGSYWDESPEPVPEAARVESQIPERAASSPAETTETPKEWPAAEPVSFFGKLSSLFGVVRKTA
jgi:hypothetical protein